MTKSRILIADSNQGSLAQLRDYLAAQDGTRAVDTATDGVEALKLLRSQRYDVLITELIMPQMDGFGLIENISLGLIDSPPAILVVSAMRNESIIQRACSLGAKYYMIKPVEPETVYKRMLDMLEETSNLRFGRQCAANPRRKNYIGVPLNRHSRPYQGIPIPS